jgi:hypothetical protein
VHFSKRSPIGYGAALSLTASGDGFLASLMPIGVSVRLGAAGFGWATGISTVSDGFKPAVPVRGWFELPLGPLHVTLDAQLDYRFTASPARVGPLNSDLAQAGVALRLPGDRALWPKAFAGVGPYVRAAVFDFGADVAFFNVTAGVQLFGAD